MGANVFASLVSRIIDEDGNPILEVNPEARRKRELWFCGDA